MPGIYINDGGQTASALGNVLGGLATELGPEAAAKAQLLREQTEQADWSNRLLSTQVPAAEQAGAAVPGLLSTFDANAQPTGSAVGNTVANAAVPPDGVTPPGSPGQGVGSSARTVVNTSSYTPFQKYVANEVLAGRMLPSALTTAVNLGQQKTLGPGNTYEVQGEVGKARQMPVAVGAGTKYYPDPNNPAVSLSGPDTYTTTAVTGEATSDAANADIASKRGNQATSNSGELQTLNDLYDKAWNTGDSDWATVAGDLGVKALADKTGVDFTKFSSRLEALSAIKARMLAMIGSARASQGDPALRGGLDYMATTLPNPDLPPEQFHGMSDAFGRVLNQQINEGNIARTYQGSGLTKADGDAMRNSIAQSRAQALADLSKSHPEIKMGTYSGAAAPAAAAPAAAPAGAPAPAAAPAAAAPQGAKPKFNLVPDIATGMKLPSGSLFRTPDGKPYKVP